MEMTELKQLLSLVDDNAQIKLSVRSNKYPHLKYDGIFGGVEIKDFENITIVATEVEDNDE